jgi:hypothetical protein
MKYTDPWCDATISAAAIKAGIPRDIFPRECGCGAHIEAFKKIGAWQESDRFIPRPSDLVFYDWQDTGVGDNHGAPDHVGMVDEVFPGKLSGKLKVIEGNMGGKVGYRQLDINGRYIRGYATPKYEEEDDVKEKIVVIIHGQRMEGYLIDGSAYIPARKGIQAYDDKAKVVWDDKTRTVKVE